MDELEVSDSKGLDFSHEVYEMGLPIVTDPELEDLRYLDQVEMQY